MNEWINVKDRFPEHISLSLEHNPHKGCYETAEYYLKNSLSYGELHEYISDDEFKKCIETDEIWIIQLYPKNPTSFKLGIASSFEKAMEVIIND